MSSRAETHLRSGTSAKGPAMTVDTASRIIFIFVTFVSIISFQVVSPGSAWAAAERSNPGRAGHGYIYDAESSGSGARHRGSAHIRLRSKSPDIGYDVPRLLCETRNGVATNNGVGGAPELGGFKNPITEAEINSINRGF
jgi:hypothetical protein